MSIEKNISGDDHELLVQGRVDGALANALEVEVLSAMRAGAKAIYLNFANASFLCSAAIRVVMQYHRQMKTQGKKLLISRVSPEVDSILEMTGFRDLIVEKT
ncbi:MAG: STAS domain-containing protein [Verrucomicrobia bacterium]|nr:STAS domain-containing protein [Verrucomicrobiota bacterium]MBI3868748.1 STAS domain-containing protein [Verrucomicrobiota bacterium]